MSIEIVVPQVGEAISAARLVQWYKKVGEFVKVGEPLFAVDTDKAVLDVEAFCEGTLQEIIFGENSDVQPGMVVGRMSGGTDKPKTAAEAAQAAPAEAPISPASRAMVESPSDIRQSVSPKARRLARELRVNLAELIASRPGAMITEEDVRAAASGPST
jgi:pyruvate/2-oxoglutarate dehydrogenase complex dihydrolipoamide acyltransferase (E2) component